METAQNYYVNLNIDGAIIGSCEVTADSMQEACEIVGQKLIIKASKFYKPTNKKE